MSVNNKDMYNYRPTRCFVVDIIYNGQDFTLVVERYSGVMEPIKTRKHSRTLQWCSPRYRTNKKKENTVGTLHEPLCKQ
ncbi:hypothetical protein HanIR_Chr11g0545101 [Helianthus annuus]|nr:hypothetical protein HanIR_Chr11g0545101 [Helianthus annuus]